MVDFLYLCTMRYQNYKYIYPPRPKNCVSPEDLVELDNDTLVAQPKLNGSNSSFYLNPEKLMVMNRYNAVLTNVQMSPDEIKKLYKGDGGWTVLNGEYMNKSKCDKNGEVFNHKFVIFDILVLNGNYLIGHTFEERILLLDELYGTNDSDQEHLYSVSENIYRAKSYTSNFLELYCDLIPTDMMEGLVMKRKKAKLELGLTVDNNCRSQLKCRKPTKNYKF